MNSILDLSSPPDGFGVNPFPIYEALVRDAPVCPQADGSFIISRHSDLLSIYRDTAGYTSDKQQAFAPKFGAGSPLYEHHTSSLVFNDPPLHTRVRRIMTSALTPKALERLVPGLTKTVSDLLGTLPDTPDLIDDFAARIPIQVIGNLLDIPMSERGPLRAWSLAILGALEPVLTTKQLDAGQCAVRAFSDYLDQLIAARRRSPGNPEVDVLTRLIAGDEEGQLSASELIHNCIFILNAGHETTTNLIGSALSLFDELPHAREQLLAHPERIDLAIEEVLRFRSPNQFGTRQTARSVVLSGVNIPKGRVLHLCIGAANRDPDVFAAPQRFDIARRSNRHLAFASGAHVCVGLTLARMEGRIAISEFLRCFPQYRITNRLPGGRIRFHGFSRLKAKLR